MNINIANNGRQLAIVKDNPKFKNIVFSVSEDASLDSKLTPTFDEYSIKEGQFQYIPSKERDRDTFFICGSSGSGKSYWTASYVKEYIKIYPKNPIYLISECKEDKVLDDIKEIKRMKLDDSLIDNPIDFNDFQDCCCIFDDTDALTGKLGKSVYALRDKLLKNGRKQHVTVISTNHTCTGLELKAVLNESDVIVFFLRNYNRALKYLLENYVGLNKQGVSNLKRNKSRWTAYIKSYPNVILQEHNITTIEKIQES